MAKLTGPLLSFGAKGQIGKTLVTADWKGIKYARQYTVPANPNTSGQQLTRGVFGFLQSFWLNSPTLFRAPWTANAVGRGYTDRNKLVAENMPVLRGETDCLLFIGSPGALGGPPADTIVAVAGAVAGDLEVTVTCPDPPTGWTLASVTMCAFPDQDPGTAFTGPIVAASDAASPFVQTLAGLPAGATCIAVAWPVWTRPDGKTAYGPAILDDGASHA